ncbi:hypothetical protein HK405_003151, partial [Cladochytrium tenue]
MGPKKKKAAAGAVAQAAPAAAPASSSTPAPPQPTPPPPDAVADAAADADADDAPPEDDSRASKDLRSMAAAAGAADTAAGAVDETAAGKAMSFLAKELTRIRASRATRDKELSKIAVTSDDVGVV